MSKFFKFVVWCASRPRWVIILSALFILALRGSLYGLMHHEINPDNHSVQYGRSLNDLPVHLIHLEAEKRPRSPRHFSYVDSFSLEPHLSSVKTHTFIIIIISSLERFEHRQLIRDSWGKVKSPHKSMEHSFTLQRLFVIENIQNLTHNQREEILDEQDSFHDILSIDGVFESPLSNTFKQLYALHYVVRKLHDRFDYIMKSDDSTFVNIAKVLATSWAHLGEDDTTPDLLCYYLDETKVLPPNTFQEHLAQYEPDVYHRHCTGPVYVASSAVVPRLLAVSLQEPMIQNTNAMLTGETVQESGDVIVFDLDVQEILFYNSSQPNKRPLMSPEQFYAMNLPVSLWKLVQEQLTGIEMNRIIRSGDSGGHQHHDSHRHTEHTEHHGHRGHHRPDGHHEHLGKIGHHGEHGQHGLHGHHQRLGTHQEGNHGHDHVEAVHKDTSDHQRSHSMRTPS